MAQDNSIFKLISQSMTQAGTCQLHYSLPAHGTRMLNKVLCLLKEHGVHTCYALSPHCDGQFSAQKLRPECRASTWLSQQHHCHLSGAKCSIIMSHRGRTFHFYLYTERASSNSRSSCASKASKTTCLCYCTYQHGSK